MSDSSTEFQNSRRYTPLWKKSCHVFSVAGCGLTAPAGPKLYWKTIAIGTTKKNASQPTGRPSKPGVANPFRRRLRSLHLFPDRLVYPPPRDVAVEVGVRLGDALGVVQVEG